MNLITRRFIQAKVSFTYLIVTILIKLGFFKNKFNNIWLVSERGIDARDNGYFFYKYLKEKHPEINSHYVISKESADYNKIAAMGNVIEYRSINHYIALIKAKKLISTHIFGYTPEMNIFMQMEKRNILPLKGKKVFLQHGITKDKMNLNSNLDIFVTSVKREYEFIKDNYPSYRKSVVLTGMPRYDSLKNVESNNILVMPTWRLYLQNVSSIKRTEYYKAYMDLLGSKDLNVILEKNNIKLIFYPHIEMQKFISEFRFQNKNIIIANFKDYDVQELLKSCKLLITDYSSVYFDFAYLNKPVIYYQFDQKEYRKNHYSEGYFDYYKDGFGPVYIDVNNVVKEVEKLINNKFNIDTKYQNRISRFFTLRDNKNCERIFELIKNVGE